jgi:hypothetical protein
MREEEKVPGPDPRKGLYPYYRSPMIKIDIEKNYNPRKQRLKDISQLSIQITDRTLGANRTIAHSCNKLDGMHWRKAVQY